MATRTAGIILTKTPCRQCGGLGRELDHENIGANLSRLRARRGLKQSEVAKSMGISDGYVSDLELGKRSWSTALIEAYRRALK